MVVMMNWMKTEKAGSFAAMMRHSFYFSALNTVHPGFYYYFPGWSVSSGAEGKFRIFLYHAVFALNLVMSIAGGRCR